MGERVTTPSSVPPAGDLDALERHVGALWLARDVVRVHGADATSYLQGQCSQDVETLDAGAAADALLLSPQGKIDALVRVVRVGDDDFLLDTEGGFGPAVVARLERFKLRVRVEVDPLPWRALALRGDRADPAVFGGSPGASGGDGLGGRTAPGPEVTVAVPYSWNGVRGVDLLGPAPAVPAGVRVCAPAALEVLRIKAGIPRAGAEIDERTIPAEVGLVGRCVSFTKGCYTGQELVARLDARGTNVARRLSRVVVDGPAVHGDAAALWHATVVVDGADAGTVTSAALDPRDGTVTALAFLHRRVTPPCEVTLRSPTAADRPEDPPASIRARAFPIELATD